MASRFVASTTGPALAFTAMGSWLAARGQQQVHDPAVEATAVLKVQAERQELVTNSHDPSDAFDWRRPAPISREHV
jgi:hypothetical protein